MSMAHITHNWDGFIFFFFLIFVFLFESFVTILYIWYYKIICVFVCVCKRKKIHIFRVFQPLLVFSDAHPMHTIRTNHWIPVPMAAVLCVFFFCFITFSIWGAVSACDWVPEYVIRIPFTSFFLYYIFHILFVLVVVVHICLIRCVTFHVVPFWKDIKNKKREDERNDEKCLKD